MNNDDNAPPGMWIGYRGRLPSCDVYYPRFGAHLMELTCPHSEHTTHLAAKQAAREAAWARYRQDMSPEEQANGVSYKYRPPVD